MNGWEVAAIITVQSGTPFSVLTDSTAFVNARADWSPKANCQPSRNGSIVTLLDMYFNVSCFIPATAPGDFGDTGRNILEGPRQMDVDISLVKFIPITEFKQIELRAEFFNAFNNVSFANPVNILASANAGAIVATTTGPRVIQFAAKFTF